MRKHQGKSPLGRPRSTWEDHIKFRKIWRKMWTGFNWHRIWSNWFAFVNTWRTFGSIKWRTSCVNYKVFKEDSVPWSKVESFRFLEPLLSKYWFETWHCNPHPPLHARSGCILHWVLNYQRRVVHICVFALDGCLLPACPDERTACCMNIHAQFCQQPLYINRVTVPDYQTVKVVNSQINERIKLWCIYLIRLLNV